MAPVCSRGGPFERVAARVCREVGATVATHVLVRDLNVAPARPDEPRIEVIADGLPLVGEAQLALNTALVSPRTAAGIRPTAGPKPSSRGPRCHGAATASAFALRRSALLSFAAARSFAASLLVLPLFGTANLDGEVPLLSDVLADSAELPPIASRLPRACIPADSREKNLQLTDDQAKNRRSMYIVHVVTKEDATLSPVQYAGFKPG